MSFNRENVASLLAECQRRYGGILKYKIPPNVILGPGDKFFLTTQMKASFITKESVIKFYADLTKDDGKGVTIMLPVNYQSEIDPNTKLNLITEYKITKNAARLIRSEMKIFDMHNNSEKL